MRYAVVFFLTAIFLSPAMAGETVPSAGWPLILDDYNRGVITLDQKAEYALTLLTSPENLPDRYKIDKPMRSATMMILDIMTDKDRIDPEIINRYFVALNRVNKQAYYDTPEGNFRIHYDTTGTHVVYEAWVDSNPADGVPDYVNRTGEYFERAWHFQADTLGYDFPPYDASSGGGNNLYDIYMHHYSGAYGVTWPENYSNQRPNRNSDMTSYIYVDPNYNGFGYPDRTLPMKVTSAHEFFHAVQMAYNASAGGWFMENCAVWMEEKMWDDINDCYFYMSYFFNNPQYSFYTSNGSYEYGAFVWPTYIDERYGQDVIRTIWEYTIYTSALNATMAVLDDEGSGIQEDYPTYAVWNYLTGSRSDGQHYSEGSDYNQVRIMRTHTNYPVPSNNSWMQPSVFGCNYILFTRGNNTGNLRINFDGADAGTWVVPVVKSTSINQHEFDEIVLDGDGAGEIVISGIENYIGIAIIPCLILGPTSNFTYSAQLDTLTSVPEAEASLPAELCLYGNYPNPFNNNTVISFYAPEQFAGRGNITVYDQLGRSVWASGMDIINGLNTFPVNLNNKDDIASGLYYYKIEVKGGNLSGRMTYLK